MCKAVEIGKRGEYHPCIKNPIKKILTINFHQKMSQLKNTHTDIIAPNFTNFYRRIFLNI